MSYGSVGKPRVGFYGCANRVVRMILAPGTEPDHPRSYPSVLIIECPACGHEHRVKPAWRARVEKIDADREPDYVVGA